MSKNESEIRIMEYPALAGGRPVIKTQAPPDPVERVRELEAQLEMSERRFAQGLENATRDALERGRGLAGAEQAALREQCVTQLKNAVEDFRSHRDEYFARVEHEVVRLALAIAERILHREAQLDPLLLSGAVRVALGQLAEGTEVRLRVPAAQKEMWSEVVRLMPGLPLRPEVRADESLREGEAALEAALGAVDLGVRAQLTEIERSFFDAHESVPDLEGLEPDPAAAGGKRG
ncbi:MAG TPA: FliH/SctL family protein [Acidobacteriaceae bacterium]|nr:FliH/SctL family protein [Acidobacteriaceae bacterium]